MKIEPFPGELRKELVHRPFVTKTGRNGCQNVMAVVLTDEQTEWLRRWFPLIENPLLMQMSTMSHSTLHRFARQMGLTKSEKGIKRIKKRQAAHIKKVCERNGYYASLRGHRPSEACCEGIRKMWAEIRTGKREHPMKILRSKNPRKYAASMKRRSKSRRELFAKEIMRITYGLPRETKLRHVTAYPYTRKQVCHRYSALQRGYYVMEDCSENSGERYNIYYDENTVRSPRFENNLINDGFRVLAGA